MKYKSSTTNKHKNSLFEEKRKIWFVWWTIISMPLCAKMFSILLFISHNGFSHNLMHYASKLSWFERTLQKWFEQNSKRSKCTVLLFKLERICCIRNRLCQKYLHQNWLRSCSYRCKLGISDFFSFAHCIGLGAKVRIVQEKRQWIFTAIWHCAK